MNNNNNGNGKNKNHKNKVVMTTLIGFVIAEPPSFSMDRRKKGVEQARTCRTRTRNPRGPRLLIKENSAILNFYRGYIEIMEKKMEATIEGLGLIEE